MPQITDDEMSLFQTLKKRFEQNPYNVGDTEDEPTDYGFTDNCFQGQALEQYLEFQNEFY